MAQSPIGEIMKLITSKSIPMILCGLFFSLNANAEPVTTKKTWIDGSVSQNFSVYQSQTAYLPFVVCMNDDICPERTTKTIVDNVIVRNEADEFKLDPNSIKIYFNFNSSLIDESDESNKIQLESMVSMLKDSNGSGDDLVIKLRGWTDPIGGTNSTKNRKLAQRRVNSVIKYLSAHGITAQFQKTYSPPCCNRQGKASDDDEVRKEMRVVEIFLNDFIKNRQDKQIKPYVVPQELESATEGNSNNNVLGVIETE